MAQEKDLYPKFRRWLKKYRRETGGYELKLARGKSLPFSALNPQQENVLLIQKHGFCSYKIPDDAIGFKLIDIIAFFEESAFVAPFYDNGKRGYLIDIDMWIHERDTSERKSLTEERADEIKTGEIIRF